MIDATRLPGDSSPYWIQSALDIRQQFKLLCKRGDRLQLWYAPQESIVSVVLEVGNNGDIVLDVGPDAKVNQAMLAAPRVVMDARLAGVELKCEIGPLVEVTHEGLAAFAAAPPLRLHRLQRREFHRVSIPVGLAVGCSIPESLEQADNKSSSAKRLEVQILDMSLDGLAFEMPADASLELDMGAMLNQCSLQLDDLGVVTVNLEVRSISLIHSRRGSERRKVGCTFIKLPYSAEQLIQRCIMRIELEQKALGSR